jgi:hypothetical protein
MSQAPGVLHIGRAACGASGLEYRPSRLRRIGRAPARKPAYDPLV